MLKFQDSPQHAALLIQGKREDLDELYEALQKSLNHFQEPTEEVPLTGYTLQILSFCYDIRQAIMRAATQGDDDDSEDDDEAEGQDIFLAPDGDGDNEVYVAPDDHEMPEESPRESPGHQSNFIAFPGAHKVRGVPGDKDSMGKAYSVSRVSPPHGGAVEPGLLLDKLPPLMVAVLWPEALYLCLVIQKFLGYTKFLTMAKRLKQGDLRADWLTLRKFQVEILQTFCQTVQKKSCVSVFEDFLDSYSTTPDIEYPQFVQKMNVHYLNTPIDKRLRALGRLPGSLRRPPQDYYTLRDYLVLEAQRQGCLPVELELELDFPDPFIL